LATKKKTGDTELRENGQGTRRRFPSSLRKNKSGPSFYYSYVSLKDPAGRTNKSGKMKTIKESRGEDFRGGKKEIGGGSSSWRGGGGNNKFIFRWREGKQGRRVMRFDRNVAREFYLTKKQGVRK